MESPFLALLICLFLILKILFSKLVFHRSLSNPFPLHPTLLREFKCFLIICIKNHCPSSHILVILNALSAPIHFMFISLPFLFFFYPLFLSIISLSFSSLPNEFWRPFSSVSCMLRLSSLLQLFVSFEECGVSVHFCQLIHHSIPHVLCNTSLSPTIFISLSHFSFFGPGPQ